MLCIEFYIALSTLLCSIAALVVAYISLRISKQVAILNSSNFTPRFKIQFIKDGIKIKNEDSNLYDIRMIEIVEIQHTGYFIKNSADSIDIPIVKYARRFGDAYDYNSILNKSKLLYLKGDREVDLIEIPSSIINDIFRIMQKDYGFESKLGYASPAMCYKEYYVSIDYLTKYNELKHYSIYRRAGSRGVGEYRQVISENDYKDIINNYKMPRFENAEEIIEYCAKNRRIIYDRVENI